MVRTIVVYEAIAWPGRKNSITADVKLMNILRFASFHFCVNGGHKKNSSHTLEATFVVRI